MIVAKINGKYCEFSPGTTINFKLYNPLFNEDNLSPGSYTLSFQMPSGEASPVNSEIFGHPDVIENQQGFVKLDTELFFDLVKFRSGKIRVKNITDRSINTNFVFGLSTISEEIKTKKIRELLDDEFVLDNTSITKKIIVKPHPAYGDPIKPWPIIVNGKSYEEDTIDDLVDAINNNTDGARASATKVTSGTSSGGLTAPYIVLQSADDPNNPLAELSVDVEANTIIDTATGNIFGYKYQFHPEMGDQNMSAYYDPYWNVLEDYMTGSYPDDRLRFPAVFNQYGEPKVEPYLYNGISTYNGTASLNFITNGYPNTNRMVCENRNSIHPFVPLKYVLNKIAEFFDFSWEGDFYTDSDLAEILIWNPNNLDEFMDFIGTKKFQFWKRSFNLKDLVPDLTVRELLLALQSRYNLAVYKNELSGKVRLVKREPIAKSTAYKDINRISSNSDPKEDMSLTGIKLISTKEDKDTLVQEDSISIGDPEVTYPSQISTVYGARQVQGPPLAKSGPTPWYNWITKEVWGVRAGHAPQDKFELRTFYYKGLFNNGEISYPRADRDATNYKGTFAGENGIYENFWKRWIEYTLRRKLAFNKIDFEFRELKDLDWEKKHRFDRNNYLIKSLDFEISPEGLTSCKAELYTMR